MGADEGVHPGRGLQHGLDVDLQLLAGVPGGGRPPRVLPAGGGGVGDTGDHRVPQRNKDQGHIQGNSERKSE